MQACVEAKWTNDRGADGQFESEFIGYEIADGRVVNGEFVHTPEEDLAQALAMAERQCAPGNGIVAGQELQRMRALTKSRAEPGVDAAFTAVAMFEEASAYPDDVIVDACRKRSAMETFFPSWAELKDVLERRMRKRRALVAALEAALKKAQRRAQAEQAPPAAEPSIDERHRVGDMLGELGNRMRAFPGPEPRKPFPIEESPPDTPPGYVVPGETLRRVHTNVRDVTLLREFRTKCRDGRYFIEGPDGCRFEDPAADPGEAPAAVDEGEGWGS